MKKLLPLATVIVLTGLTVFLVKSILDSPRKRELDDIVLEELDSLLDLLNNRLEFESYYLFKRFEAKVYDMGSREAHLELLSKVEEIMSNFDYAILRVDSAEVSIDKQWGYLKSKLIS